jgi:threonine/homoserine/homoserine lactone efflux protein
MDIEILALLAFLFPLAYSPGPGNLLFAANGARFGIRSTIPASTGYHLATVSVTFLLGIGFLKAVAMAPNVLATLHIAGALYVMWLASKLWRTEAPGSTKAKPIGFLEGFVLLLLNPKAYVIIGLMFSQFLDQGTDIARIAMISVVFMLNNLVAFTLWTLIGDAIARRLRSEANTLRVNRLFAGALGIVGVCILVF